MKLTDPLKFCIPANDRYYHKSRWMPFISYAKNTTGEDLEDLQTFHDLCKIFEVK